MLGHFILNCDYKGQLHRVSEKHFNKTGKITHVTVFPVNGSADEVLRGTTKIGVNEIELHQAA